MPDSPTQIFVSPCARSPRIIDGQCQTWPPDAPLPPVSPRPRPPHTGRGAWPSASSTRSRIPNPQAGFWPLLSRQRPWMPNSWLEMGSEHHSQSGGDKPYPPGLCPGADTSSPDGVHGGGLTGEPEDRLVTDGVLAPTGHAPPLPPPPPPTALVPCYSQQLSQHVSPPFCSQVSLVSKPAKTDEERLSTVCKKLIQFKGLNGWVWKWEVRHC